MKIREIIDALEKFAPLPLQEEYDNSGLQVGLTETEVSGALLCLDVTGDAVREAVRTGCNLIVSHHPLLFHPLSSVTDRTETGRCVIEAIKNDITIYSAHTNLDKTKDGVNFVIASKLGLKNVRWIGECGENYGAGLMGELDADMREDDFAEYVKQVFALVQMRHNAFNDRKIRKVAVCGGSGAFLIPDAYRNGADAFITGEIGYHRFYGYDDRMLLMEIGHYESEQFTLELLESLIESVSSDAPVRTVRIDTNLVKYY